VRRVVEHPYPFAKRANNDVILLRVEVFEGLLEISNTTMDDFSRGARSGPAEIAGFNEGNVESPQSRIDGTGSANRPTSNDAQVESFSRDVL
jgi:hypothetical protein